MNEVNDNILKIKCLDYNEQCMYVANKLLSYNLIDITHTIFFFKIICVIEKIT